MFFFSLVFDVPKNDEKLKYVRRKEEEEEEKNGRTRMRAKGKGRKLQTRITTPRTTVHN